MEGLQLINAKFISKNLKYADLIPAVAESLVEYSSNASSQPLRSKVSVERSQGLLLSMPAYSQSCDALSTKLLSIFPDNSMKNLPVIQSYILLFNPERGNLECVMDGNKVTGMRTAAASVVATQALLAEKPRILSILGSGVQARAHILAMTSVYTFDNIKIWSRTFEKVKDLCKEFPQFMMTPCETAKEAAADSDIIVTVTNSASPILKGEWLKPGCHINCVGACLPNQREVDDNCLQDSVVYTDSRESAANESGDIIATKTEVYAEIGEILMKKKPVKRAKFTFYKSLGIALQDAAAAQLVWERKQHPQ